MSSQSTAPAAHEVNLTLFLDTIFGIKPDTIFVVFQPGERGPSDEQLRLQFEAISKLPREDKKVVQAILDGMIVKHRTKQLVGELRS